MHKGKFNASEKLAILQEIERGLGVKATAKKYEVSKVTLFQWQKRYELYGYEGLEITTHNRSYS
ncbi:helix-turn-helix domain-containing protein [Thermoactinomyces sp. DSM 45892]|uniref:helix-turn-helix domain-containing protein n=1 Tax=Thermoactinomyces sp. DSM 45892 TaxID=1882753 RepID=UPI000898823B|nr:helix-turn-helix domain-containing protein [Thermoactinomyces sp. DSM 45892]SDY35429.1 Transposase [Thermoactinomyces sp. DSM 45892]